MIQIPFIPESAPFTREQRIWLNGYLAGLFSDATSTFAQGSKLETLALPPANPKPLLLLYGSQTGTAEGLAKRVSKEAAAIGFTPMLVCMEDYEKADLAAERSLLLITSTYGDGEPPDNAQAFWSHLSSDAAPSLDALRFSVLALGDTTYPAFCEFGKKCDARLEELGAMRIHPRVDCDVEYEEPANAWMAAVLAALSGSLGPNADDRNTGAVEQRRSDASQPAPETYSRKNPFPARLLANRLLSASGSAKEVRHYELSLEGSGMEYEAGDALGVTPSNCPALVDEILDLLRCDGEEAVNILDEGETSLRLALTQHYDITKPSRELIEAVAARSGAGFEVLLQPERINDLKQYLWGREVVDLLAQMHSMFTPSEFVALLKKLSPRLYSIASSPKAHPGEVHLTVGTVRYETFGRRRKGVCSTFLADRCIKHTQLPVFIQTSKGFRLPADSARPVVMIGPGTGIAPFRAFLQERRESGAKGLNWLFFGEQRRATDFLYREELETMSADGHLTRLDLAFSREQEEKIYVQTRMLEAADQLWGWLQEGAHLYVCGDASRMAKDVDSALHKICESAGGLSREEAANYIARLKTEKRYQRDVY